MERKFTRLCISAVPSGLSTLFIRSTQDRLGERGRREAERKPNELDWRNILGFGASEAAVGVRQLGRTGVF